MKTVREKSDQATLPKHAFTVEEFQRLAEAGIVAEDERIELMGGDLIEKAPIGSRHAATVAQLEHLLAPLLDAQHILWTQNPVRLGALFDEPRRLMATKDGKAWLKERYGRGYLPMHGALLKIRAISIEF